MMGLRISHPAWKWVVRASLLALFVLGGSSVWAASETPQRIVSMAPSLTEILFDLGTGDQVVGVTTFCDYPPEATNRPRVGGFYDPNYEVIVSLQPDLAVLLNSQDEAKSRLEKLGIRTITVNHETIASVVDSITSIGDAVGAPAKAREITDNMNRQLEFVKTQIEGLACPTVLVAIGRNMGSNAINDVFVAAPNSLYDEMLRRAGGKNALEAGRALYPSVSLEGILKMDPEVVFDMVGDLPTTSGLSVEKIQTQWKSLEHIRAVKTGRVYVIEGTYALRPGPRLVLTIEKMARMLHPEARWDSQ